MAPTWSFQLRLWALLAAAVNYGAVDAAVTVNSTILVIARDANASYSGTSVLNGYGIPFQVVDMSLMGAGFPQLNTTPDTGNFGGIVTVSARKYKGADDWKGALNDRQWQELYKYQENFGVRMVRLNSYPSSDFGVQAAGDASTADLPVAITDAKEFATANLVANAQMGTMNLTKYPAKISNASLATEIASFSGSSKSTAAVVNKFPSGRQQQVWFMEFPTDSSHVPTLLSHAWIHWMTRGLFLGFRRIYFNTQVDDVFEKTELYESNEPYRIKPDDFKEHVTWMKDLNSRLPSGSSYVIELGHNGNGNIWSAVDNDYDNDPAKCNPQEGIDYPTQIDGNPEIVKPIGTGTDYWDKKFKKYQWSLECSALDSLEVYFADKKNMNAYFHVSHTFTHLDETNATYSDVVKEISWNQEWFKRIGFTDAESSPYFSPAGLIPPGITGLHNGDAIRAWLENGIKYAVGDNARPILMDRVDRKSPFHPILSNVAENGYAGVWIVGRWGSSIYYNCDLPACVNKEWKAIAKGTGDFNAQLEYEKGVNAKNLLGLRWDPFMFHQANMRISDTPKTTLLGKNQKWSLLMAWTESVLGELIRLTQWPIVTLKHDDIAKTIINRKTLDECRPNMAYQLSDDRASITGVVVNAANARCSTGIPVTFPGQVASASGATKEQLGKDPLTLWVSLGGSRRSYALSSAIKVR